MNIIKKLKYFIISLSMILIFTILFIGIKNQELMHQIQISTISQVQNENHSLNLLTKKLKSPLLSQSDKLFILGYMNLIEGNKELYKSR